MSEQTDGPGAHWVMARVAAGAFWLDQGAGRFIDGLGWRRLGHEGRLCLKDLILWLVQLAGTRGKSNYSYHLFTNLLKLLLVRCD